MMKKAALVLILAFVAVLLTACGCSHEHTSLIGYLQETCQNEGYSGDVYCNDCKKTIEQGKVLPKAEHTASSERSGVYQATCTEDGYSGDIICTACGTILEKGKTIPATGHTPEKEYRYAEEATCTREGYSGSLYCSTCGTCIEYGTTVSAKGHRFVPPEGVTVNPCLGYIGKCTCIVCGAVEERSFIISDHQFVGNECSVCGWMKPGFYRNGEMVMTWEEMEENNYATVYKDGSLGGISADLSGGTLVIGEDVKTLPRWSLNGTKAEEIWIPRSVTHLPEELLYNDETVRSLIIYARDNYIYGFLSPIVGAYKFHKTNVEKVVLKFPLTYIGSADDPIFGQITSIELPEGLEEIGSRSFMDYQGSEIKLPSTLKMIRSFAFANSALKQIDFPEGLIRIDDHAFQNSQLTSVVLPSSVDYVDYNAFSDCGELQSVDMSACTKLGFATDTGNKLKMFTMPPNITKFSGVFSRGSIKRIVFPDSLTRWEIGWHDNGESPLEEVVWPVKLTDVSKEVIQSLTHLTRICYCGTETQWQMNAASSMFGSNVLIVYNWEEPTNP